MQEVSLNNGVKIPQFGLGVFKTPEGEQTVSAVKWALEAGYRHIDTAKVYGNEKGVGLGIQESKVPREEIFLTTKLWNDDIRAGRTREAFAESLAALQTDYVDLYLIHWPADGYERAWAVMEELYQEGKIKAIGVSNFQKRHLECLEKTAKIAPAVNQIEAHPYFSNQELIDYCKARRIVVEAYRPLGGTGGNLLEDETLRALAQKYERTPAQIALRWAIQRDTVVVAKSTHQERIVSNMKIFDFVLSDTDMETIDGLNRNTRLGSDPDNFNF
ncbi:aldo/keto reductase [Anaerotruncus rubiinfantis]|uniref:aldo/keto reductase n=1 Tax=Anaerotruncus rubiinfantis TaxID=1720200 RepID=UPI00189ADA58|nr:aldo/keto reductase [Anaerotruncus rubiinfantis]